MLLLRIIHAPLNLHWEYNVDGVASKVNFPQPITKSEAKLTT